MSVSSTPSNFSVTENSGQMCLKTIPLYSSAVEHVPDGSTSNYHIVKKFSVLNF